MRNDGTDITAEVKAPFLPKAVLIAYERKDGYNRSDYYLESRPVLEDGSMGAACGASVALMERIAASWGEVKRTKTPFGAVPRNLLWADVRDSSHTLVWWNPPCRRHMAFDPKSGIPDGDYNMPGVVYKVQNATLSVYAFAGKRPSDSSRLFLGPFYNCYADGRICLGNTPRPSPENPSWDELLSAWERAFWDSINVHPIARTVKGDYRDALLASASAPFDMKASVSLKTTLADVLDRKK